MVTCDVGRASPMGLLLPSSACLSGFQPPSGRSWCLVLTGRRPSPQTVHTSRGDHPVMIRRGHSIGNAAKWSMPRDAGTVSGWVAIVQTEPGSLPRGLVALGPPPSARVGPFALWPAATADATLKP